MVLTLTSPAECIRTALASHTALSLPDGPVLFADRLPSILLVTRAARARRLLTQGRIRLAADEVPRIGLVRLGGLTRQVTSQTATDALAEVRHVHAGCPGCLDEGDHVVLEVELDEVTLRGPGGTPEPIPLAALGACRPDWVVAWGHQMAVHLGRVHADELGAVGARLSGIAPEEILATDLPWVDERGAELVVLSRTGALTYWLPFAQPPITPQEMTQAMHAVLQVRRD